MAKSAPNPSWGERTQKVASEAAQASAFLGALCGSGPALVSIRAGESQKACCGTQGRRHLLGPRKKRVVGLFHGPNPSGVAENLEGFLGGRLACSLGPTKPHHTLSVLSRLDPRALAQVAVTAVSWGSVPPHPAAPCLWALQQRPAELGITLRCPGAISGLESHHVGLQGLQSVDWSLF